VSPWFFLLAALLGMNSGNIFFVLLWVVVLFVSILVHELGHAFAYRYYGMPARIVLYMMGGLAISESWGSRRMETVSRIVISAAGPAAGFLLAGIVIAAIVLSGGKFFLQPALIFWNVELPFQVAFIPGRVAPSNSMLLAQFIHQMLYVNILWGLVNLLPIYPLDGGQISRELFSTKDPFQGTRNSLILSAVTAGAVAVYGLTHGSFFLGIFFGVLAYQSFQASQNMTGGGRRPW
jgi:Zn-dependent protease